MQRKAIGVVLVHPETPDFHTDADAWDRFVYPLINQKALELLPTDVKAFNINLLETTLIMARGEAIRRAVAFEVVEFIANRTMTAPTETPIATAA